jgi:hypothetical protein
MRSLLENTGRLTTAVLALILFSLAQAPTTIQIQTRRLILRDGTYQSITKYEIQGERIRYFSAERGEWEEVPKSLIDWDATAKFQQDSQQGKLAPEAIELDRQIEAERKVEQARSPEVAPGLRLPDANGIYLLDNYQSQPQIIELQQPGGDVDKNTKSNILRAAINPLSGTKKTIDLPESHAKIQAHTTVPSLYLNIDSDEGAPATVQAAGGPPPLPPAERFKIIHLEVKGGKRIAGAVKVAVTGKMKTDERFVAATVTTMTGGWVKLTPTEDLPPGEYAVAEMMGKEAMNLYVWDFGVNPSAPANASALKPDPIDTQPKTDQPADLKKREKQ